MHRAADLASLVLLATVTACKTPVETPPPEPWTRPTGEIVAAPAPARSVTLSIVGTNDVHGRVDALPVFGGYLGNLRARASSTAACCSSTPATSSRGRWSRTSARAR
ncbi:MAG: hypothetical protein WKG00_08655 [Polyangiaceae bacterium]